MELLITDNKSPSEYPERILLVVTGLTPQVLTETVYALTQTLDPAFLPTQIHLLTTSEGAERAALSLLHADEGWFHRLCRDYELDGTVFHTGNIHSIKDSEGGPLSDIRTEVDNRLAADAITETVRELTSGQSSSLHVSIAGGRKTMGFYAGSALSFFGRPQDRISHVLVSSPFENNKQFYYPTPYSMLIDTESPTSRPLDAKTAKVTLADIPFVRLRDTLHASALNRMNTYTETVRAAQPDTSAPRLIVNEKERTLKLGEKVLNPPSSIFSTYAWFAYRRMNEMEPVGRRDFSEFAEEYARFNPDAEQEQGHYERSSAALESGVDEGYFDRLRSRAEKYLKEHLGPAAGQPYFIHNIGRRPNSRYGLILPPENIVFRRNA